MVKEKLFQAKKTYDVEVQKFRRECPVASWRVGSGVRL